MLTCTLQVDPERPAHPNASCLGAGRRHFYLTGQCVQSHQGTSAHNYYQSGLLCLLNVWKAHPDRLIGPFARCRDKNGYVLDELVTIPGSEYHMVLPRIMMLDAKFLPAYAAPRFEALRSYVDEQEVRSFF